MPRLERLRDDERAVEGLPIRLVVGVVVGVASLSVMLNMLSGVGSLAVAELDAVPSPEVVAPGGTHTLTVTAVDADGDPVAGATVILRGDTAALDGVRTAKTGSNGTATLELTPTLAGHRDVGRVTIAVNPPPGGGYVDRRPNAAILVVRES